MLTANPSRYPPLALRSSRWDALLVTLALAHAAFLIAAPSVALIALGVWWNSNTISHNFIHNPFFRSRQLNQLFSIYQSVLLGIPQALWRQRHLAHHAGKRWHLKPEPLLLIESALVLGTWAAIVIWNPQFFATVYLPGYLSGLALCALQGHYEHARGTISHYSPLYNLACFNDGYHVEHHLEPGRHWTRLPERVQTGAATSRWPALLRWMDTIAVLNALERAVLHSARLRSFLIDRHRRTFALLLPQIPNLRRIAIVGGGLFPRTALALRSLLPTAELVLIDASAENLQAARAFLDSSVSVINDWYDPARHGGFDLVVIPLAFVGDKNALYDRPPAPALMVHDWIWRRRGASRVVSPLLCKRLNLVRS